MEDFSKSQLRTLDDFLLGSARFQMPNFNDLEKWQHRVVNNLLYYQTNYMLMGIIILPIVSILYSAKTLFGTVCILMALGLFYYSSNLKSSAMVTIQQFKEKHPIVGVFLILSSVYFMVYLMDVVFVFMFGILLQICITFIHASMRLRNIKNKLSNKMEMIGLKKTPMGNFLETYGLMPVRMRTKQYATDVPKSDILYKAKY